MKASYRWLQSYFDAPLPSPEKVAELLTFHSFEVETVEKAEGDFVFDIDVLPNRAHDCLSHLGIARELSVLLEMPLTRDMLREKEQTLPTSSRFTLSINDALNAPRHIAALISGVTVKESPEWLKRDLESIGQRSINNIVDATNYIMFVLGQPTHVFDADKLIEKGGTIGITIRSARKGEKITLLGGGAYELNEGMLVLADTHSGAVLDIAGIKGGVSAELTDTTSSIVLSGANFKGTSIRKTSQRLKLRTEASVRFENGLVPELAYYGITEAVKLIQDIAGGEVEGYVDEYPLRRSIQYKIGVSTDEVNKLLGTNMSEKDIENILSRLGFIYEKVNPVEKALMLASALENVPYKYGASISYDAPHAFDCSSFVGYVFAQAGVSLPRIAIDQYIYSSSVEKKELLPGDLIFSTNGDPAKKHRFTRLLDGAEVVHSGTAESSQEFLSGTKVEGGVSHCGMYIGKGKVIHASKSRGVVIEDVETSDYFKYIVGYRRVARGEKRYVVTVPFERLDLQARVSFLTSGNKEDLIEEIGRIYGYHNIPAKTPPLSDKKPEVAKSYYYAEKIRDFLTKKGFTEVYTYSLRNSGELELENPLARDKNFFRKSLSPGVSQSVEHNVRFTDIFGTDRIALFEIGNVFSDGREYTSVCIHLRYKDSKKNIASEEIEQIISDLDTFLGVDIQENMLRVQDKKGNSARYEFSLNKIINSLPQPIKYDIMPEKREVSYAPFSLYPFVLRDIAVWVPEHVETQELEKDIQTYAGNLLVRVTLFDEFKKDGHVSYAFRLVFQSHERTLSDEEVNEVMENVITALQKKEGFEVR